jgi:hypothetical protein
MECTAPQESLRKILGAKVEYQAQGESMFKRALPLLPLRRDRLLSCTLLLACMYASASPDAKPPPPLLRLATEVQNLLATRVATIELAKGCPNEEALKRQHQDWLERRKSFVQAGQLAFLLSSHAIAESIGQQTREVFNTFSDEFMKRTTARARRIALATVGQLQHPERCVGADRVLNSLDQPQDFWVRHADYAELLAKMIDAAHQEQKAHRLLNGGGIGGAGR